MNIINKHIVKVGDKWHYFNPGSKTDYTFLITGITSENKIEGLEVDNKVGNGYSVGISLNYTYGTGECYNYWSKVNKNCKLCQRLSY